MSTGYLDSAERVHRAGGATSADRERPNPAAFEAAARTERDRGQTPAGDGGTRSGQGHSGQAYLDSAERVRRAGPSTAAAATPTTAAPRPGEVPVSPARAARIDDWVAQRSDPHNDGFLRLNHHSGAEKVGDALAGRSELGALGADEQRHLMDGVLARWADGRGDGANGPGNLVRELPDDPGVRGIVAERTALRAGMLADRPPPRDEVERYLARTETAMYAQAAVEAVSGPAGRPPGDLAALRDMVGRLGPEGAAGLARALDPDPTGLTPPGSLPNGIEGPAGANAESMGRTLAALNGGARTGATGAFVQNAFALATPNAYLLSITPRPGASEPRGAEGVPDPRREMATALAREWHPDAPEAAAAEAERLRGILDAPQGLDLLAARSDGPSLDARVNALATLRLHPEITADTLRATRDPWTNPAITGPAAQAQAQPFLARGDAPRVLRGSDLDNTVGVAMGRTPATPPGMTPEAAEAALARGEANFFHGDEAVGAVSDAIHSAGGEDARVAVLPVTYSSGATGPVRLPLFRVETAAGERFVDNRGRTYESFEHWRTTNALPPGIVHYPEGGHLSAGPDGRVRLGRGNTPKTVDTWGERAGQILDTAALVGGVVVTGLVIAGTGGTAVLVVGAGVAVWNGARGVQALQDRAEHGQSLSLADSQARGLWLGLAADTAAVGAFGSAARLARLGRTGRAIAPLEASAHGYVQAGANLADAAAIGDQGVDLVRNWDSMAPQDRAQAVLQMGFWGAASLAGARASGARPGEVFDSIAIRERLLRSDERRVPPEADPIDGTPETGRTAATQPPAAGLPESRFNLDGNKFKYFFGEIEAPEPTLRQTDPYRYKRLKHNYDRSQQIRDDLARIGIEDDESGRSQLRSIFERGLDSPSVSTHTGDYGTTVTREIRQGDVLLQIKYFYRDGNTGVPPDVVSLIPKVMR